MKYSFSRNDRLAGKKNIEHLFTSGQRLSIGTLRFLWIANSAGDKAGVKIAISVSKKLHKKAVDRNKIRRRIREAYRIRKKEILEAAIAMHSEIHIMIIYYSTEIMSYDVIAEWIKTAMQRIQEKLCKK